MKHIAILPILLFVFAACTSSAQEKRTSDQAFTDLSVEEFKIKMQEDNIVILDVRTPQETAAGKIEGAIEMDILAPDFSEKASQLDPSKTYLVYCKAGGRSARACSAMSEQGFSNLYNLKGGYTAWKTSH
ncbi:MAG: rhodanese-like domain-containing protein [Bacteroidota bacterium]